MPAPTSSSLVHDLHVRVLTTNGELLRESQIDPSNGYLNLQALRAALEWKTAGTV